ncbi:MAG: CapA family protein [Oscillospiraceae bacterium]|nr:CapA family protein [Oscillospiraceae bacterium]
MKKILPIIISVLLFAGCTETQITVDPSDSQSSFGSSDTENSIPSDGSSSEQTSEPVSEPLPNPTVRLLCAGDNLIHSTIYKQAFNRTGGNGYDFSPVYEEVADIIKNADYAILNQETIITNEFEPSNYPLFVTPEACGDHMVDIGFDAMSVSNNHLLDKGEKGLKATLKYWSEKHPDILVYGASTKEKKDEIPVVDINGIKFAFLGFMEHTNQNSLPSNTDMSITYLYETERIKKLVKEADKIADVVVVSPHYGVETTGVVSASQKQITQDLVDWGADIIIGTQAHTVQPMEYVTKPDGGQAFVFYCLGNLVSHMDVPLGMMGMIGELTVTKDLQTGEIILSEPKAIPIVTHYDSTSSHANLKIYLWDNYTEELAKKHGCPGFTYSLAKNTFEKQLQIVDYLP